MENMAIVGSDSTRRRHDDDGDDAWEGREQCKTTFTGSGGD